MATKFDLWPIATQDTPAELCGVEDSKGRACVGAQGHTGQHYRHNPQFGFVPFAMHRA